MDVIGEDGAAIFKWIVSADAAAQASMSIVADRIVTRSRIEAHSSNCERLHHVTKVPLTPRKWSVIVAICLAVLPCAGASIGQASPTQPSPSQASPSHRSGPAESLYLELSSVGLDTGRVFQGAGASLDRSAIHITLEDGTIAFTKDVLGRITGAFFEGEGEVLLAPPNDVERKSMSLFTGMAILEERFSTAYFRFNDNTATELQPGLRAPSRPSSLSPGGTGQPETWRRWTPCECWRVSARCCRPQAGQPPTTHQPQEPQIPMTACCTSAAGKQTLAFSTYSTTRWP